MMQAVYGVRSDPFVPLPCQPLHASRPYPNPSNVRPGGVSSRSLNENGRYYGVTSSEDGLFSSYVEHQRGSKYRNEETWCQSQHVPEKEEYGSGCATAEVASFPKFRASGHGSPPIDGSGRPEFGLSRPIDGLGRPIDGSGRPEFGLSRPIDGSGRPIDGSGRPIDGSGRQEFNSGVEHRQPKRTMTTNTSAFPRRQTWSPAKPKQQPSLSVRTGSEVIGMATRRYSNDRTVDLEAESFYDDSISPPKLAPISGRLPVVADHPLVKPIPFKPVAMPSNCHDDPSSRRRDSSQNSSLDRQATTTTTAFGVMKFRVNDDASHGVDSTTRDWQNLSSSSGVSQNSFSASQNSFSGAELSRNGSGSDEQQQRRRCWSSSAYAVDASSYVAEVGPVLLERSRGEQRTSERTSSSSASYGRCRRGYGFAQTQTPSPCDSGVGELEAMLREKDVELQTLRDTMERNETAMIQVFEEKRQNWQTEMADVIQEWEIRVRVNQQKSFRREQGLMLQIIKLQRDDKLLRDSLEQLKADGGGTPGRQERNVEVDLEAVRAKVEELVWEKREKDGEIASLRTQLKSTVEEASNRSMELLSAQLSMKDGEMEVECKNAEIHRLVTDLNRTKHVLGEVTGQKLSLECRLEKLESLVAPAEGGRSGSPAETEDPTERESLEVELSVARKDLEDLRATLEQERERWTEEKSKVINYQKHLQLNYVQMARKNRMLEVEVQQMSSELERHDVDCHLPPMTTTVEESFC